jgi:hypothetical protein
VWLLGFSLAFAMQRNNLRTTYVSCKCTSSRVDGWQHSARRNGKLYTWTVDYWQLLALFILDSLYVSPV